MTSFSLASDMAKRKQIDSTEWVLGCFLDHLLLLSFFSLSALVFWFWFWLYIPRLFLVVINSWGSIHSLTIIECPLWARPNSGAADRQQWSEQGRCCLLDLTPCPILLWVWTLCTPLIWGQLDSKKLIYSLLASALKHTSPLDGRKVKNNRQRWGVGTFIHSFLFSERKSHYMLPRLDFNSWAQTILHPWLPE